MTEISEEEARIYGNVIREAITEARKANVGTFNVDGEWIPNTEETRQVAAFNEFQAAKRVVHRAIWKASSFTFRMKWRIANRKWKPVNL